MSNATDFDWNWYSSGTATTEWRFSYASYENPIKTLNWSWLGIIEIEHGNTIQKDLKPSAKRGKLQPPKTPLRRGYKLEHLKHEYSGIKYP